MRTAIISDIHGNLVALKCVLSDFKGVDQVVCLGDVATSGPQPNEVVACLQALNCPVVRGNMDDWIMAPPPRTGDSRPMTDIQYWGAASLSSGHRDYLQTFQRTVDVEIGESLRLLCCHGCPTSNERGMKPQTPDEELQHMLEGCDADLVAGGHTHRQMHRRFGDVTILNPGTVGAPMPKMDSEPRMDRSEHLMLAEYAVVDSTDGVLSIELRRIRIDVDLLVESIYCSGMPHPEWWLNARYGYRRS